MILEEMRDTLKQIEEHLRFFRELAGVLFEIERVPDYELSPEERRALFGPIPEFTDVTMKGFQASEDLNRKVADQAEAAKRFPGTWFNQQASEDLDQTRESLKERVRDTERNLKNMEVEYSRRLAMGDTASLYAKERLRELQLEHIQATEALRKLGDFPKTTFHSDEELFGEVKQGAHNESAVERFDPNV